MILLGIFGGAVLVLLYMFVFVKVITHDHNRSRTLPAVEAVENLDHVKPAADHDVQARDN